MKCMYYENTMNIEERSYYPRRLCFKIMILIALLSLYATQSLARDSSDEDISWIKQFVNGIGEMLYFSAWPTATYKGVSFEGLSREYGGLNIKIKLHGISSFDDSSLWTEVILVMREGEIRDIKWGKNNAILFQPGETMIVLGELLVEINKEYNRTKQRESPSELYYIACIINKVNGKVNYQYRWGNEADWTSNSLDENTSYWHGSKANQKFFVKFDNSYSDGYQKTEYYLDSYSTRYRCNGGKKYEFYYTDGKIDMKYIN